MYKNEGLAYAMQSADKKKLAVYLPNGELTLDLAHEMLGDIKYDPKGSLIKTTGFRGDHFDETDEDRRTKVPFDAGVSSSAFGDGLFMVYYAVLNAKGEVIVKPSLLGNYVINAYEEPIYHDGKLHWVSSRYGTFYINAATLKLNYPYSLHSDSVSSE